MLPGPKSLASKATRRMSIKRYDKNQEQEAGAPCARCAACTIRAVRQATRPAGRSRSHGQNENEVDGVWRHRPHISRQVVTRDALFESAGPPEEVPAEDRADLAVDRGGVEVARAALRGVVLEDEAGQRVQAAL